MFGLLFNVMGGFGKLPMIIGGIMLVSASFWTWLAVHDHNLRNEVIAEFNEAQEKLLAEKKEEFDRQVKELQDKSENMRKLIETKNTELETLVTEIERGMTSKDGKNAASPYLKEIVGKMQKSFGEKK
jgi:Tfp pilus assembly protein FimV